MAQLTVRIERTQPTPGKKAGSVSIEVTATGNVLAQARETFPAETSDGYILDRLLRRAKEMMQQLAAAQIPQSFSFTVDSDQMRNRILFDL